MKHVILMPIWAILFVLSLLIGSVCWLYQFSTADFRRGTRFINTSVFKFAHWYVEV